MQIFVDFADIKNSKFLFKYLTIIQQQFSLIIIEIFLLLRGVLFNLEKRGKLFYSIACVAHFQFNLEIFLGLLDSNDRRQWGAIQLDFFLSTD